MSGELRRLVDTIPDHSRKKEFDSEMGSFLQLFSRYQQERNKCPELNWDLIRVPDVVQLDCLNPSVNFTVLNQLAILKVNGGLGTSMGMTGAKSALTVKDDLTFLDLTIMQVKHLNETHHVDVPLVFMTSFNTEDDTLRIVRNYANQNVRITTFNQSRYPRIIQDTLLPSPRRADDDKKNWYPPGHGDLYNALLHSGVLDQLLEDGKEYLFVSNSDNLGATVDTRIMQYMIDEQIEFLMEVTGKTKADLQGGTLVDLNGSLCLLELGQVPPQHIEDFQSVRKFGIVNTNNLWINLRALKRIMDKGRMDLDIIVTPNATSDGQSVIQLETAAGAAIKYFENAHAVNVPRSRFLPVKNCSDLLLIKSGIYNIQNGQLVLDSNRMFNATPVIKLGEHFKNIHEFQRRFKQIPNIVDLDHLTVAGDVYFGRSVTLRGTVIVVAKDGQKIDVPDGTILENRLVSGNLLSIKSTEIKCYRRLGIHYHRRFGL
ncbi:UTP-glucose-1-phosphate uridylyltransferase [Guyanagaster necrorhizus]|uniref:UTP--glucose-1-phosphate uridylyltransferase n=1 Tax=Guyanagaster necrorhizus TaxID=856835 RepID=A0A9P7VT77_9AGAR|nr:UTP-glucose-1-phosphate uridylyltransferase [Guyanagaster necrorhizus MCA 3950]KAG7446245.1 UTP-glucose-1-phosphate uridylyltransferase [Guyanagaster necrorhizus MCA 3950]